MGYRLGVDLGTTYTAAAVTSTGRAEMLGLGIRAMQVPSVLFLRDDGEIVVGEAAERRARPTRTGGAGVQAADRRPRADHGRRASPYSAQALTAQLLPWVVGIATERQGGPPAR